MKGIIQITALAALMCFGTVASAQNLILNPDFDHNGHASTLDWLHLGGSNAAASTFGDVPFAGYVNLVGSLTQTVHLTAGDEYDFSGEATLIGKGAASLLTVSGGLFNTPVSALDVTGPFNFDFTATKTGAYTVSFGTFSKGSGELSGLSLTQVQQTPEPCSIMALGVGIAGIFRSRKRRITA